MNNKISLNNFQYSLFHHYNNFQFSKIFIFIPIANLYFFHVITSAWFFNLNDHVIYQMVRKKFLFFTKIIALGHLVFLVAAMLLINYNLTKGIISFSLLTSFYLFFLICFPFLITWEKKKIWKICLKYSDDQSKLVELPLSEYLTNFIDNITNNLFKINNLPGWFFQQYQDKATVYDSTKPTNEVYNPIKSTIRFDGINTFLGIRNASIIFSSSIYYGLVVIVKKLLKANYEISKIKLPFIASFLSATNTFCFWIFNFFLAAFALILFPGDKIYFLLSILPYIYGSFLFLISIMLVFKFIVSKHVRNKLASILTSHLETIKNKP